MMDIDFLLYLQHVRDNMPVWFNDGIMAVTDSALVALWLVPMAVFWCLSKRLGAILMMGYGFSISLNLALKNTFCVYRPWVRSAEILPYGDAKLSAGGYSFPSGHTQAMTSQLGGVSMYYHRQKWLMVVVLTMILLVMFSRMYLGCHTPQDVFVGFFVGAAGPLLAWWAIGKAEANPRWEKWVVLGWIVFAVCCISWSCLKGGYPMDYDEQGRLLVDPVKMRLDIFKATGYASFAALGWMVERRYICLDIEVALWRRLLRLVAGALVYLWLEGLIKAHLHVFGNEIYYFVLRSFIPFFVCIIWPLVIKTVTLAASRLLPSRK